MLELIDLKGGQVAFDARAPLATMRRAR